MTRAVQACAWTPYLDGDQNGKGTRLDGYRCAVRASTSSHERYALYATMMQQTIEYRNVDFIYTHLDNTRKWRPR